jgi:uncharacterized protein (DUF1800 family)
MSQQAAIALVRFGTGAKPGDMERVAEDPAGWLKGQITPRAALREKGKLPTSLEAIEAFAQMRQARRAKTPDAKAKSDAFRTLSRATLRKEIQAKIAHGVETQTPFAERWADFWTNHFTVAATRPETVPLAGPFEREAIRPHVFGPFAKLLEAATLHPAMLGYLDNHRSIGPSTRLAKRRNMGLNENLAREVLELHTLGVDGGYSQGDVESFAMALTGWVPAFTPAARGAKTPSIFASRIHEPGTKSVLGKRFKDSGADQARDILAFLAQQKATARHIAFKLARHFIADTPPQGAVDALTRSFMSSDGDLAALATTLINLPEAWSLPLQKIKTPQELMISAARMLGPLPVFGKARKTFSGFAQTPYTAPSPAGWPDEASAWLSPDALKKRIEWANLVSQRTRLSAQRFAQSALGPLVDPSLSAALSRAESPAQAMTLALMSPAFQRR